MMMSQVLTSYIPTALDRTIEQERLQRFSGAGQPISGVDAPARSS